jgi:hypothetical protein
MRYLYGILGDRQDGDAKSERRWRKGPMGRGKVMKGCERFKMKGVTMTLGTRDDAEGEFHKKCD